VLVAPVSPDLFGDAVDDGAVDRGRSADARPLQDRREGSTLGGLESHVAPDALGARVHVAAKLFGRNVRALFEDDDLEPGLAEHAGRRRAGGAAPDDDDIRDVFHTRTRRDFVEWDDDPARHGVASSFPAHDGGTASIG
jgi:hypothetical protein